MEANSSIAGMMFRSRADAALSLEFVGEGSREVCGYTPSELVDTGLIALPDLIHPEDREYVRARIQAGISGRHSFIVQTRLFLKDRTQADGILVGTGNFKNPLSLTGLEGYLIRFLPQVVREVTSGFPSPDICMQLLSNTEEVIALIDDEGKIAYITPSLTRVLGSDPDMVSGQPFYLVLPQPEQLRFEELRSQVGAGQKSSARFFSILPDGTPRQILVRLFSPSGLKGMIVSVSPAPDEHEPTVVRESLFHDVFSEMPVPMILTTAGELNILEMNDAALTYASSHSDMHLLGKNLYETGFFSHDGIEDIRTELAGSNSAEIISSGLFGDLIQVTARNLRSKEGDLIVWAVSPKQPDIESVILEKPVHPSRREIQSSFLWSMRMIRSVLQQKHSGSSDPLESIVKYSRILLDMVMILYESEESAGRGILLCKFLHRFADSLREEYGDTLQTITISTGCTTEDITDESSTLKLGIISLELVQNAIRHAFTPGQEGRISITFRREEDWYILEVRDNGKGLSDSIIRAGSTTGGFYTAESLSMELSGTMTLANDGGAVIRVIFPVR